MIDDGTGLTWTEGENTYTGVKVSLGDTSFLPLKDSEGVDYDVGDYVEGVNGICSIMMIGDTPYRCVRQVGLFKKSGPSWFPVNKINRSVKPR